MKSLLLISHSSNRTGGGEDDYYRLLKHLSSKYNILSVFPTGPRAEEFIKYSDKYRIIPDGIFPFQKFDIKKYLHYLYISIKKIKHLYSFLKTNRKNIDVCFVNSSVCLIEIFVLNIFKIPYVLSIKEKINPFFVRYFIYLYYRLTAYKIIFISKYLQDAFLKYFKFPDSRIIYSSIDNEEYELMKSGIINNPEIMKFKDKEKFSVLNVGSIWRHKNQKLLIDSLNYINSDCKIKIKFIGKVVDESYFNILAKIADKYKTSENIEICFAGEMEKVNLLKEMYLSDCVVITSLQEGMSLVIVETLFMNKPLITTKVGIAVEVITDGVNGLLLENFKPETMANKINSLMDSFDLRKKLSLNSIDVVSKCFNIEKYNKEHEEFILK